MSASPEEAVDILGDVLAEKLSAINESIEALVSAVLCLNVTMASKSLPPREPTEKTS